MKKLYILLLSLLAASAIADPSAVGFFVRHTGLSKVELKYVQQSVKDRLGDTAYVDFLSITNATMSKGAMTGALVWAQSDQVKWFTKTKVDVIQSQVTTDASALDSKTNCLVIIYCPDGDFLKAEAKAGITEITNSVKDIKP